MAQSNRFMNKFMSVIAERSAKADSRVECFYKRHNENTESHVTIALKPSIAGHYAVIRNGKVENVKHANILSSDLLAIKVSVDMFALSTRTIHRFDASSEYVKVSSSFEVGIALNSDDLQITALTRNEDKELTLSDMMRLKGKSFSHISESDIMSFARLNVGKFVNMIVNNTESNPRKREFANREQTELTIYGMYKAQQATRRQAKIDSTKESTAIVTTESLSPATK